MSHGMRSTIFNLRLGRKVVCCGILTVCVSGLPGGRTTHAELVFAGQDASEIATAAAAQQAYDVASIKAHRSGDRQTDMDSNNQSYTASNVSLKNLLMDAYGIREDLISGIPKWAEDARFDLQAKIVDPDIQALKKLTREQRRGMLAAVLVERFHLKVHTETKILPVFDLVVTKGGPKFKEVILQSQAPGVNSVRKPSGTDIHGSGQLTEMVATAVPISLLAYHLGQQLKRTVIDETDLPGKYDFSFKWSPDELAAESTYDAGSTDTGTSIFTALQEQLGLKLISAKGPVVTLVVDQADPPTAN
jgi:uncharacterized protein (TIGR03435 family)